MANLSQLLLQFPQEIWKDITGYEGCYQISSFGRVKSLERTVLVMSKRAHPHLKRWSEIILKNKFRHGYPCVTLSKNDIEAYPYIHRLVAQAFISNPENKPEVNHIDGNRANNNLSNLEWVTGEENIRHAIKTRPFWGRPRTRFTMLDPIIGTLKSGTDLVEGG